MREGGRLFCRQPDSVLRLPICAYPTSCQLSPQSQSLFFPPPSVMATPFLQQEGFDRVLSLKFVPTALVPVVWDWQFQEADGPGGYAALPEQLSWERGRSSREMFLWAGAQERISPGHGSPSPRAVKNSGPSTYWFSLRKASLWHGRPQTFRTLGLVSATTVLQGARVGRPAWLAASAALRRPGPRGHPSGSPAAAELDPLRRERFEGQTLG